MTQHSVNKQVCLPSDARSVGENFHKYSSLLFILSISFKLSNPIIPQPIINHLR